jgi:hypothetical protein
VYGPLKEQACCARPLTCVVFPTKKVTDPVGKTQIQVLRVAFTIFFSKDSSYHISITGCYHNEEMSYIYAAVRTGRSLRSKRNEHVIWRAYLSARL